MPASLRRVSSVPAPIPVAFSGSGKTRAQIPLATSPPWSECASSPLFTTIYFLSFPHPSASSLGLRPSSCYACQRKAIYATLQKPGPRQETRPSRTDGRAFYHASPNKAIFYPQPEANQTTYIPSERTGFQLEIAKGSHPLRPASQRPSRRPAPLPITGPVSTAATSIPPR